MKMSINGVTLQEAKEVLVKVREIERRHPTDLIYVNIKDSEDSPVDEMRQILKQVFPRVKDEKPVFLSSDDYKEFEVLDLIGQTVFSKDPREVEEAEMIKLTIPVPVGTVMVALRAWGPKLMLWPVPPSTKMVDQY